MEIKEVLLTDEIARTLIDMSAEWEAEDITYGYRKNECSDLEGKRIFIAEENGEIIGFLFGRLEKSKDNGAVVPDGADYFEVNEIYVKSAYRSQGVGSALFRSMEEQVRLEAEYIMLGTATKDFRAILHFYVDEMGMEFWSAALFKKLQ